MAALPKENQLFKSTRGMLLSLTVQFILGMVINLFAVPPDEITPAHTDPVFAKITFAAHGINGIFIVLNSLFLLYLTRKTGWQKRLSIFGFVSVLVAAGGGIATISLKGNSSEVASLMMAIGFICAFASYGKLIMRLKDK